MRAIADFAARIVVGLALAAGLAIVAPAQAATATYSVLLDTDSNAATGCTVSGPSGPVTGIEQVATTVVDTTSAGATVTRLERQVCSGTALGATSAYDPGGWPVGFGNGTGGVAVVEASIPLAMLPPGASMRVVALSSGGGGQDVTTPFAIDLVSVGAPSGGVVPVPLSPWLVLPLSVGILLVALWMRRRYPHHTFLTAFLVVFALSGLAWAATVVRDGNVGDWVGVAPAVADAKGDAPPDADMVALFYQQDASNLYLRFDTDLRKDVVNQAPAVSAGPGQTITLPAMASLTGAASDDGLPNPPGAITLAWSKVSGPGTVAFGNASSAVTTASFSLAGTYVLRLMASDGALSRSSDVTIVVNDVAPPGGNLPPVVGAGSAQSITLPATASLAGSATDDGNPTLPGILLVTWSVASGPGLVTFAMPNAVSTQARFSAPGTYVLMLTAFDGELSSSATTQVTVADGGPQIAPIADRTIAVGTRMQVVVQASDAAGDVLTYSLPAAPPGSTLSPSPLIDWTPSAAQVGTHAFTAQVTDGNGHSATVSFNVTVTAPANTPPALATQENQVVAIGTPFARKLVASDPDAGEVLTFSLVSGPPGMTLTGADLSWPTTGRSAGDYNVTVRVTDKAGALDQKTFTVTLPPSALPFAFDDRYKVRVGALLNVAAPGVLANDGPPGTPLTASKLTDPAKGTLSSLNADGSFTYQAPAAFVPPGVNPTTMWREPVLVSGFAQVVDHNHDGFPDIVVRRENILQSFDGKTGAFQWTFDPTDTTVASVLGCEFFNGADTFATGDVDGSGTVFAVASLHCGPYGGEFYAADMTHVTSGKVHAKWLSRNMTQPHPGAYANPGDTVLPIPPIRPFFQATLGSEPTLAKLTSSGGVKMLARRVIASTDGLYYPAGGGSTYAACRSVTALPADEGRACRATYILDAANGAVEAVLTAPNLSNQKDTGDAWPTRQGGVVVADLDGDGQVEIISGSDVYKLASGAWTLAWQSTFEPNMVAVTDLDGDGKAEVVMYQTSFGLDSTADRGIYIYRHDGTLLRRIPLPPTPGPESWLTVGDIDGDGAPEILAPMGGYVYAYRGDGRLAWIYAVPDSPEVLSGVTPNPVEPYYRTGITAAQVYDLNLDGKPEVILSVAARVIILDGATGAELWSIDHEGAGGGTRALALADTDGDGHVDIVTSGPTRWNCSVLTFGPMPCVGNLMVLKGESHWAPGPKAFNQTFFRSGAVDDMGRILYDASVQRVFKMPVQQGVVIDPRARDGTTFTYDATANGLTSPPATVAIAIEPANHAPVITSVPPNGLLSAPPFTRPVYQITAVDPDAGDTIHYALVSTTHPFAPSGGVVVNAATGAVDFHVGPCGSGGPCAFGNIVVVVAAIDSFGARTEQSFIANIGSDLAVVPDVVGQQKQAAFDVILAANLTPRVQQEVFGPQPAGTVLAQFPLAGAPDIVIGTAVDLVVSKGPQPVTMPFVVGMQIANAYPTLTALGLSVNLTSAFSATIPAGEVMTQSPVSGTRLVPATAPPVELTVSAGGPLQAPIARIDLVPGSVTRVATEQIGFRAVATLTDGTSADVTVKASWTSSTTSVATVAPGGIAKAIAAGTTTIAAAVGSVQGNATLSVVTRALVDTTPPVAQIAAPPEGSSQGLPVPVTGTATDANFARYELAIAIAGSEDFTIIAEGTSPVSGGTLGTFDPTLLANDMYTLRLTAYDRAKNVSVAEVTLQATGRRKPGLFALAYTDLSLPSPGVPVTVQRMYDSRVKSVGDFGFGWRIAMRTLTLRTNRVLGTGWQRTVSGPTVSLNALGEHRVSVTLSDGTVEVFDMQLSPTSNLGSLDFTHVSGFTPRTGTLGKLEYLGNPDLAILNDGARDALVDDTTFETFDPRRFRYTAVDGMKIEIDRIDGVSKVEDRNGNTVSFGPAGIIHSSGQSVVFTRDAKGRVVQMIDPRGQALSYGYDENGDLARVTDATGAVSTYKYDRFHNLIEARDASGKAGVRTEYDDQGRLIGIVDAAGKRVAIDPSVSTGVDTITDRRGNVTRVDYDADGNVTKKQVAVSVDGTLVNAVTTKSYDPFGNETAVQDPDGRKTSATFSTVFPLTSVVDPGGLNLTTTAAYNAANDPTTLTDAAGRGYTFVYDARGNMVGATAPSIGASSTLVDARGLVVERTDALGNRTTFAYDTAGHTIREEAYQGTSALLRRRDWTYDANGNVASETLYRTIDGSLTALATEYTYDAGNRVVAVKDPIGAVTRTEYDASGRVTARIDALGRRTTSAYDVLGQLERTTYPDGTFTAWTYDSNGNVVTETDRAGRVTQHAYDELDRRIATTAPDGAIKRFVYSPGGVLAAFIDERGNRTDFAYDAAGRLVATTLPSVTDASTGTSSRPTTTRTLDPSGLVLQITDAKGRTKSRTIDANGRPSSVALPDGSLVKDTYDALGRLIRRENEEGQATDYTYDALGRLTSVSGFAGTASFTYDEGGLLTSRTDALGRITRFRYDRAGRLIEQVYPSGANDKFVVDAAGNGIATIDGLGRTTTFTYDAMNRVVRKDLPGVGATLYTYTPDGRMATVTDARGVATYTYDARGRPASTVQPGGEVVTYSYGFDDLLSAVGTAAAAVTYAYDAIGRLIAVAGPEGASTQGYDLVGNKTRASAANGMTLEQVFDVRDRPTSIVYRAAGGATLASFTNAWSLSGRRTQTTEAGGSSETFGYDAFGRLVSHSRAGTGAFMASYAYDVVGNRTQAVVDGTSTTFSYDVDDRLVSDSGHTYTYDAAGNMTGRTGPSGTVTYGWDAERRLRSVASGSGVTQYEYDAFGHRVQATSGAALTRFLVAENNPTRHAQVLEERDGLGNVKARYSFGTALAAMQRGGTASYPIADAQGSVRALASQAGAVTDAYSYGAYGTAASATGSTVNPYRFAGERLDMESGLYDLRARTYDASTARFLSRDPLPGRPRSPISLHRYAYANDDPVNFADPSGKESLASLSLAQSINSTIEKSYQAQQVNQACNAFSSLRTAGYLFLGGELAISLYESQETWGKFKRAFSVYATNPTAITSDDVKSVDFRLETGPAIKLAIGYKDGKSKAYSVEPTGVYRSVSEKLWEKKITKCGTVPIGAVSVKATSKDLIWWPTYTLIPAISYEFDVLGVFKHEWKVYDGLSYSATEILDDLGKLLGGF